MLTPTISGESVVDIKRKIRSNSKFLRGRVSVEERNHAATHLVQHAEQISALTCAPKDGVVGVYYPIGGEVSPLPLVDWLRQIGWKIALPCVDEEKQPLVFRLWNVDDELVSGVHQIKQPGALAQTCVPDILVTPMLAFDKHGRRLGYGGGYYDRTLAQFVKDGHKVTTIGLAFSVQEIEQVPFDKWDHAMDMILTERGVFDV